ncbi:hypothetical protein RMCBS344292_07625 [Rhizopus microsporus]|nr:hypothetical protein RMCBS344292_07625 [Rhizopus microsporus]
MQASTDNYTELVENFVPQPMFQCLAPDESKSPFVPYYLDKQQEDNLSIDILQLYQKLLPTKESYERRLKFVKKMEKLLNSEWPDHDIKAHVFGSSMNDLGTGSSDIDLCITTPWNGLRNVRVLAKLFKRCGMQHVVCVPRAKVPIVRLFDPEQLSCDINVNNTLALQNTKMIKVYVALDPRVRPLIMTVKHWTKQRQLNDAANGGTLSSYTWTCMIINFLQQREPPILPILHATENEELNNDEYYFCDDIKKWKGFGLKNKESLGGLLYAFFRRFAIEFDYDSQVVSVRQGKYLTKNEKGWDTGRNRTSLCVEEPFNTQRNLGNSADVTSVLGLRCEFQRCLDLVLDHADLETICTPYKHMFHASDHNTDIPTTNIFSLTLPAYSDDNHKIELTAHPHDRRKSMVDGICHYQQLPKTPLSSPYRPSALHSTFYPRFSSSQALDTIIQSRTTRHGSHPLSPVPSSLLSMLNISRDTNHPRSIDSLFTRHQKKPTRQREDNKEGFVKRNGYQRKKVFDHQNSHHRQQQKQSEERPLRRQSNGMEWPSISGHAHTSKEMGAPAVGPRRWSTVKRHGDNTNVDGNSNNSDNNSDSEEKKKTLAEIVKIAPAPTTATTKRPVANSKSFVSTATATNNGSNKSKHKKPSKSNSKNNTNHRQPKNKSNNRLRASK